MYVNEAVMLPLNVIKVVMSLMSGCPAYLENGVSKLLHVVDDVSRIQFGCVVHSLGLKALHFYPPKVLNFNPTS